MDAELYDKIASILIRLGFALLAAIIIAASVGLYLYQIAADPGKFLEMQDVVALGSIVITGGVQAFFGRVKK